MRPIGKIPEQLQSRVEDEAEDTILPRWWFVEAKDYTGFDSCLWWHYIPLLDYRRKRPHYVDLDR